MNEAVVELSNDPALAPHSGLLGAIARKLYVLRTHGIILPTVWRGLKLLGRGRFGDFARRLLSTRAASAGTSPEPMRFAISGRPTVSIILASACRPIRRRGADTYWLLPCLESIRRRTTYENYEILLLRPPKVSTDLASELSRRAVRGLSYGDTFNWSAAMNRGAAAAGGDFLLFLNDDTEVLSPQWIEAMLSLAQQPGVGAVGAKLLYPDGTIQHAGVVMDDGVPGHAFARFPDDDPAIRSLTGTVRNCSAVTGACLMTPAGIFHQLGGFDEAFPLNYSDIDYCLKVVRGGRRVVYTPAARLIHHEAQTKTGEPPGELAEFRRRWSDAR
jgi:GT2 family glycosyltransferase